MYASKDEGLTKEDNCTTVRSLGGYHEWEGSRGGIISIMDSISHTGGVFTLCLTW